MKSPNYFKCLFALLLISTLHSCKKDDGIPVADFTYSGAGTTAPTTVTFTNTSTNGTSYLWDFGDNTASNQVSPTHTYTLGGVFTVKLTVTGSGGTNSVTKTVNILTPTSVKITGVKVTSMPFLDPGCSCSWDASSGPDVYYTFTDNANNSLFTGSTYSDITAASLPLSWGVSPNYQITNFTSTYKVYVYDKDLNDIPPSTDDLIGGYSFNFSAYTTTGYPGTITLQNSSSTLKVDLILQWQ